MARPRKIVPLAEHQFREVARAYYKCRVLGAPLRSRDMRAIAAEHFGILAPQRAILIYEREAARLKAIGIPTESEELSSPSHRRAEPAWQR